MRLRFDQLGKQLGREALGSSGPTTVHEEISPDAWYADLRHEPSPARAGERTQLGLLGQIASSSCLIELYSQPLDGAGLRACLGKHIALWQQRARAHKQRSSRSARFIEPSLWVIAVGVPATLATDLGLAPASGWPLGVYRFGGRVLRVGLISAGELPRDRSTLLVRLMAAGPLLSDAIADLRKLPANAPERVIAGPVLVRLRHALEKKPRRSPAEQEFMMKMVDVWEKERVRAEKQGWKQGQKQGWEQGQKQGWEQGQKQGQRQGQRQGQKQGSIEARAKDILTVLRVRGISVPKAARERIMAEQDPKRLERWLKRAAVETSLDAVLDGPS